MSRRAKTASRPGRAGAPAAARRCIWSNQRDADTREISLQPPGRYAAETYWVCPAHEAELRAFHARLHRDKYRFLGGIALVVVAAIVAGLLDSERLGGVAMVGLGLFMLAYPFATPQTVQMMGVRASLRLVRVLTVPVVAIGLYLLLRAPG
jgi:hypothetical protein